MRLLAVWHGKTDSGGDRHDDETVECCGCDQVALSARDDRTELLRKGFPNTTRRGKIHRRRREVKSARGRGRPTRPGVAAFRSRHGSGRRSSAARNVAKVEKGRVTGRARRRSLDVTRVETRPCFLVDTRALCCGAGSGDGRGRGGRVGRRRKAPGVARVGAGGDRFGFRFDGRNLPWV